MIPRNLQISCTVVLHGGLVRRHIRRLAGYRFMVSRKSKAAIEFLHLLADISDPVTGTISCMKLAAWLGMTEDALQKRWIRRGANVAWPMFADELLAVLDAAQAQGDGLEQVIDWYFNTSIGQAGLKTADQLVMAGEARWLTQQLNTFGVVIHTTSKSREPLSRAPRRPLKSTRHLVG